MEGRQLHPTRDQAGVWRFDNNEVQKLVQQRGHKPQVLQRDEGYIASRAFQMFDQGCDLREIVVALRATPQLIRDLYEEWSVDLESAREERRARQDEAEFERAMRAIAVGAPAKSRSKRRSE